MPKNSDRTAPAVPGMSRAIASVAAKATQPRRDRTLRLSVPLTSTVLSVLAFSFTDAA